MGSIGRFEYRAGLVEAALLSRREAARHRKPYPDLAAGCDSAAEAIEARIERFDAAEAKAVSTQEERG